MSDQVRRTTGLRNRPVSSIRTRWAWLSLAFLNARPVVGDPVRDGRVVSLTRPAGRPLRRVAALCEPGAEVVRMEGHSEAALNQFGHASSRPEVGGEAVCGRLLGQPLPDLLILFGGEKPGSAWRGLGCQSVVARSPVSGHPLGHRDAVDAQGDCDSGLRPSLENQLNRSPPQSFQFRSRSFASHSEDVTEVSDKAQ